MKDRGLAEGDWNQFYPRTDGTLDQVFDYKGKIKSNYDGCWILYQERKQTQSVKIR